MLRSGAVALPSGQHFVATSSYNGDPTKYQLTFFAGSVLTARAVRDGWYWGRVQDGREEGYFHPSYVRAVEIPAQGPPPPPPPSPARALPAPAAAAAHAAAAPVDPSPPERGSSLAPANHSMNPSANGRRDDGSDFAAGTALATRKRPRPSEGAPAPAPAPAAPAARATESPSTEDGTRINTRTAATASAKSSAVVRIPVPTEHANGTRFPPGCPVLHDRSRGSVEDGSGSPVVMGVVRSAYLELTNPAFVPGSTYQISYTVASEGHWTDSSLADVMPSPEKELQYAPRCPVLVSPSFLPAPPESANRDDKKKDTDDWVSGTVVSSFRSFGGGTDESYVITLEGAHGGMGGRVSGVPREMVRYRPPVPPPPSTSSLSPSRACSGAAAATDPAALPGVAVTKVSDATGKPHFVGHLESKPAGPSSAPNVLLSTKSMKEDVSKASFSSSERGEKSNNKPVILRRIDIPERIDFERVKSALIGPDHSINRQMMKNLRVDIYVVGRDLLLPRDAQTLRDLGPLLPLASDGSSLPFVMLRGSDSKVSTAAKVIIHLLVDRAYQGEDQDDLKKVLNSAPVLEAVVTPTVADSPSLGKAVAGGSSDEGMVGTKASGEGGIAPIRHASMEENVTTVPSIPVRRVDLPKVVTARIELPRWLEISHVESIFTPDGLAKAIQETSNCTISIEKTAVRGKESPLSILVCGLEQNSVDYASRVVIDILVESGVEKSDIVGSSKGSRTRVKAETEDEPKPKRSRVEQPDNAGGGTTSNGEKFSESRLQYFPSWISIDDINSQIIGRNGEIKRDIELSIGCKIQVVDRSSIGKHFHATVTNNGPFDKERMRKAMKYIEGRVLEGVNDSQQGRFLYDMALRNSNNIYDTEIDPIVYQRELAGTKSMVWMTVIDFSCPSWFMIGRKGFLMKKIFSKTGCKTWVYTCGSQPGSYVFITGDNRESVAKARQFVTDRIERFPRLMATRSIEETVLEHEPLRLDRLKSVYFKKFGSSLDHKSLGYDQLIQFIVSIQSISTERPKPGGPPWILLHLKEEHKERVIAAMKEHSFAGVEQELPTVEENEESPTEVLQKDLGCVNTSDEGKSVVKVEQEQSTVGGDEEGEIRQEDVWSKTKVAKAIDAIVRDFGPLPLDRLKHLYTEKFGRELDYNPFGYGQLKDFITSIPTIDVRDTTEEGHTSFVLHHKI